LLGDGTAAARCAGIVKVYRGSSGEVNALRGIDVDVPAAQVTALMGPSGSGKSTLLRIVAGFDRPSAGSVEIAGVEITDLRPAAVRALRRRTISYVFQRPAENLVSYLTIRELLEHAARIGGRRRGRSSRADGLLSLMGLSHRADHRPEELSGGEQQRAAFAAALMTGPDLVVADEPTGELDSASANELMTYMTRASVEDRCAFIVATHDPVVASAATLVYHLRHGSVEAEARDERTLSVIDEAGRIQLPADWQRLFPDGRAQIQEEVDHLRIDPP
jgi:putative ABC transport system ATP-binding protein